MGDRHIGQEEGEHWGEILFLKRPLQFSFLSGALAPPAGRMDGVLLTRAEPPGVSSARREDRGLTQSRHQPRRAAKTSVAKTVIEVIPGE